MERIAGESVPGLRPLVVVLLTCLAAMALRANSFPLSSINWDEGVYFVIAQQWLAGHLPYLKVWDQHPVGLPAIIAVAGSLVGDIPLGARLAATLATGLTAAVLVRFCQRFLNSGTAGAVAAALYLLGMSQKYAVAVQTEVFNNLLVTVASYMLLREGARPRRALGRNLVHLAAAGLMLGAALQVKYVALPEAVLLSCGFLALAYGHDRSLGLGALRALVLIAGGMLPTVAVVAVYWQAGALPEFLHANVYANFDYVGIVPGLGQTAAMIRTALKPMAGLGAGLLLLCFTAPRGTGGPAEALLLRWLALWLLAAALDVCLPMKFWDHYFEVLLPPLATGCAFALLLLWRSAGRRRLALVSAALLLIAAPGTFFALQYQNWMAIRGSDDVPRRVAEDILRAGSDGHDVYAFDYDPVIYCLTGAAPLTRYVLPAELAEFSGSSGAQPRAELRAILDRAPRFIVVAIPGPSGMGAALHAMVAEHLRDYRELSSHTETIVGSHKVTVHVRR